jgi:hypothetical protein
VRALDDLRRLDDSLYERFIEARNGREAARTAKRRARKLWNDTFRGLGELLAYMKTMLAEKREATHNERAELDFGEFRDPLDNTSGTFDMSSSVVGELLEGLQDDSDKSEAERWNTVLEKLTSLEYGLRSQLDEVARRLTVALHACEMNQVLGLLDDTKNSTSEGVYAVVAAIYAEFLPDTNPTTVVPGYLSSLGRALLVRRGLADIGVKLTAYNEILQSDRTDEHEDALAGIRQWMNSFVSSGVCRAMPVADRWQMVEFDRQLADQPLSAARQTSEGLVKYIDSLASINQREVLVLHDQHALAELRESLAAARQLLDLSPTTSRDIMHRAYQAAQRLRGRHPTTDTLIGILEKCVPTTTSRDEHERFLEQLDAMLVAAG